MTKHNGTINNDYFQFLDMLREIGVTNMFGAAPYLVEMFPALTQQQARKVLMDWMQTFSDRHPPEASK